MNAKTQGRIELLVLLRTYIYNSPFAQFWAAQEDTMHNHNHAL